MLRSSLLARFLAGVFVFCLVSIPALTGLTLAAEETECERRRSAASMVSAARRCTEACPRENTPYVYEAADDGSIVARCTNGHGQEPLRYHVWTRIP